MTAELIQDSLVVWDIDAGRRLFREGFYGKPLGIPKPRDANFDAPLILDLIEATYLVERGLLRVVKDGAELTLEELLEYGERNYERFADKYLVYRDLRKRGFIITPGIKFGSDFAAYKHGPGIDHAPFIIQVRSGNDPLSALDIVRSGRLATSVRKHFTIAVPDHINKKVTYLVFEWWKA
ncbi:MAG: tRNA-intron lyase [Aigarchaeota archaeon]|nr:tRNA-intron lyase [Candidatus Pelearchaeum maunauluense]